MKRKTSKTAVSAPVEIVEAQLSQLVPHPANTRHVYPVVPMAELTLKMLVGGYDPASPVMVRELANGKLEIVRGHRRRIARIFAAFLEDFGEREPEDMDLKYVLEMWEATVVNYGNVQQAADGVDKKVFADVTVPAIMYEGDYKGSLLPLWSDNFGSDTPDTLGMAYSFRDGVVEGYSPKEIAGAIGKPVGFVKNLIGLGQVPPAVAELIVDDKLAVSVAPAIMSLPEDRRTGVVNFILSSSTDMLTAKKLTAAIKMMAEWNGFPPPLTGNPVKRNIARAFARLWNGRLQTSPTKAWEAVFTYFFANSEHKYIEPYGKSVLIKSWLESFGVIPKGKDVDNLEALARYLSTEDVACKTCPIFQLGERRLGVEIDKLPCRTNMRGKTENCLRGVTGDDPFNVVVPAVWGDLEGVEGAETGRPFVKSMDALTNAWNQRDSLEKEREAEAAAVTAKIEAKRVQDLADREAAAEKVEADTVEDDGSDDDHGKVSAYDAVVEVVEKAAGPDAPAAPNPVEVNRAKIGAYIMLHALEDGANHFMATPCHRCEHKLDGSPTSDPMVPACQWSVASLPVKFDKLVPVNNPSAHEIPVCRQFKPTGRLSDLIPAYPLNGMEIDRNMLVAQIERFIEQGNGMQWPFEWLAGTPMEKRPVVSWMPALFAEEKGDLSDGQVFMLYQLCTNEDARTARYSGDGSFYIPESHLLATRWIEVKSEEWSFE